MARKIRFPLMMSNGTEVRTIEEFRESFDLEAVVGYFADGKLLTWLQDRYYDVEFEKVSALNPESSSFKAQLCEALGVTFNEDNTEELDLDYINRRNEKKTILSQLTTDDELIKNIDYVALDQDDLLDCLDIGAKTIYLVGDTAFTVPLSVTGVIYIGRCGAKAVIRATDNVNFKEKNITFRDIQFSWDTSGITPNDSVYQVEQMLTHGQDSDAVDLLDTIAESDNPRALLVLGNYYSNNDPAKAQEYYKRAADLGYDEAQSLVRVPESDLSQTNVSKTVAPNSVELLYWKGIHNQFYSSSTRLRKRVIDYFEEAAQKGHKASFIHLKYKGMKAYDAERWLKQEANNNNTEAQYILGAGYRRKKWETRKSRVDKLFDAGNESFEKYCRDKDAKHWLEKAASNGHIPAQYELGCWYANHYEEASQSYRDSSLLWNKVGFKSNPKNNYVVKSDYTNAMIWFKKAAESGFPDALLRLGDIYDNGNFGIEEDSEKAFSYYLKAAEYGLEKAQYEVGNRYHHGIGTEQDIEKAIEWYKKSQSYIWSKDALEELGIEEEED